MVKMGDVARDAKVSVATVSKVLNGTGRISDETRQRVLSSAERLGYKPRSVAKRSRTKTVGLVIPSINNPFFPLLASSVETALNESGFNMFLCNTSRREDNELKHIRRLLDRYVDGIILFSPSEKAIEYLRRSKPSNTAVVFIEEPVNAAGRCDSFIRIDNVKGMTEALQYIVSLRHQRIAYITGPLSRACNRERLEIFKNVLGELGVPLAEELILESNFEFEGGYNLGWQLLKHPSPPTAIFTGNDLMAFGVINAAIAQGLRVPEDVSVIGFDDIPQASHFIPSLTTIRQPAKEIGKMAAHLILDKLSGTEIPEKVELPTSLVIRQSTGYCSEQFAKRVILIDETV